MTGKVTTKGIIMSNLNIRQFVLDHKDVIVKSANVLGAAAISLALTVATSTRKFDNTTSSMEEADRPTFEQSAEPDEPPVEK